MHNELEGNDRSGAEVGEDVAVCEEDGGVELEDELAKQRGDDGSDEEADDVEKRPAVHLEVEPSLRWKQKEIVITISPFER